ncbi:hypothetical protein SCLCIDRAFT_255180 [Scleroderma citrinum Foug A]|uniref:Uncharacterized protein n=1 Tax=Scleroderma citrinum Foug A TaxID=1036808 RepID=A0A0C3E1Y4_9AGAM|nr:hypothetical protein SCLCIDRAFT_255180 [Scleroderma citrinum Foug A]
MYQFTTVLIALCALFLSAVAAPLPADASVPQKRWNHTSGRGTWYHPGYGACGYQNGDNDAVVAMSIQSFNTAMCGQWVYIVDSATGQGVSAEIVDACESCDTNSLDMSPEVFQQLAPLSVGVIQIDW